MKVFDKAYEYEIIGMAAGDLAWVCKCVSDDFTRPMMQYLCVQESRLVATDGKRLHMLRKNAFEMEPGLYAVSKRGKILTLARPKDQESIPAFPNIDRVLPQGEPSFTTKFSGWNPKKERDGGMELIRLFRLFPEHTPMNLRFLADLETGPSYTVKWYGKSKAVVFESGDRYAVLMPIQDPDYNYNQDTQHVH